MRFDPQTGLVRFLEAMRYKDAAGPAKTLWLNEVRTWETVDGYTVPTIGTATWFDEGSPWAVFHVEELVYNVDVQAYVRAKGP